MGWFDKKDKDPSDSDANSEFDGDSFDSQLDDLSLDGDDFSFDPDVDDTESRSPVYKKLKNIGVDLDHIKSNALEGTTDGISKAIDNAAPKVGEAWQGGKDLISEIDTLRSESMEKIVPAYNATMRSARKLASSLEGQLPFHLDKKIVALIDKIHNPDEGGYEEQTKDQARKESQDNALADIFGAEQEQRIEDKREDALEKTFDRRIGQIHHRETAGILSVIRNQSTFQTAFIKGTFTAYLKKDLELKYKQLYAAEDTLESVKLSAKMVQERLDAIIKNTALPEADKITTSELVKKKAKEGLINTVGDKLSGYFGTMAKNFKENYLEDILGKLDMVNGMMDMGSQALEMENEFGGSKEFSWTKPIKMLLGMGTKKLTSNISSAFVKRFASNLDEKNRLAYEQYVENGGDAVKFFINGIKNGTIGADNKIAQFFRPFIAQLAPDLSPKSYIENVDYQNLDQGGKLTNRTVATIEQVIPAYLKMQTKYLEVIATGNENAEERVWNFEQGKLTTETEYQGYLTKKLVGGDNARSTEAYNRSEMVEDIQKTLKTGFDDDGPMVKELKEFFDDHMSEITTALTGIALIGYGVKGDDYSEGYSVKQLLIDLLELRNSLNAGDGNFSKMKLFTTAFANIDSKNVLDVIEWFIQFLMLPGTEDDPQVNPNTATVFQVLLDKYSVRASEITAGWLGNIAKMMRTGHADEIIKMGLGKMYSDGSVTIDKAALERLRNQQFGIFKKEEIESQQLAESNLLREKREKDEEKKSQEEWDNQDLEYKVNDFFETDEGKELIQDYLKKHPNANPETVTELEQLREQARKIVKTPKGWNAVINYLKKAKKKFDNIGSGIGETMADMADKGIHQLHNKFDASFGDTTGLLFDKDGKRRDKKSITDLEVLAWFVAIPDKTKLIEKYNSGDRIAKTAFNELPSFAIDLVRYFSTHQEELSGLTADEETLARLKPLIEADKEAKQNEVHNRLFANTNNKKAQEAIDNYQRQSNTRPGSSPTETANTNTATAPKGFVEWAGSLSRKARNKLRRMLPKGMLDAILGSNEAADTAEDAETQTRNQIESPKDLVTLASYRNKVIDSMSKNLDKLVDLVDKNSGRGTREDTGNGGGFLGRVTSSVTGSNNDTVRYTKKYGQTVVDTLKTISENTAAIKTRMDDPDFGKFTLGGLLPESIKKIVVDPIIEAMKLMGTALTGAIKFGASVIYSAASGKELTDKLGNSLSWLGTKIGNAGHAVADFGGGILGGIKDFIKDIKPIEKIKNAATSVVNTVSGGIDQTYSGLARAYDDVYSAHQTDKSKPLVSGEAFRDGLVVDEKGKKVPTVYDIKGPCYMWDKEKKERGNMVISAEDIADGDGLLFADGKQIKSTFLSRFAAKFRHAGSIVTNGLFGIPDKLVAAGTFIKEHTAFLFKKKDPFIDVYIIDKNTKKLKRVINGKDLETNKATRKYVYKGKREEEWIPLKSAYEIEHEIYEYTDSGYKVIIDKDDLANGVFDVDGNKLTRYRGASIVGKVGTAVAETIGAIGRGAVKLVKGAAGKVVDLFGKGIKLLGEGGTVLGQFVTSAFSSVVTTLTGFGLTRKDLTEVVGNRLLDIYGLLYDRLPGKKINGDNDGNGLRDGSYYDYKKRRTEHRNEVKARRDAAKKKEEETKKKMAEDGSAKGAAGAAAAGATADADENNSSGELGDKLTDLLMTVTGINAAKDAIGGWWDKKKEALSTRAGELRQAAGERIRNGAQGLRDRVTNSSAFQNAAARIRAGGNALRGGLSGGFFGAARGAGGLAMRGLGGIGRAAGSILGAGGSGLLKAAGLGLRLGGGALGLAGRAAGALLGGPIGWIIGLGTLGYMTYKLATDSSATKLLRIPRAKAYGLTVKQWEAFEDLETDTYEAWKNGQEGVDKDRLEQFGEKIDLIGGAGITSSADFNLDGDAAEDSKVDFLRQWYKVRFVPAYRDYVKILCQVTHNDGSKQPKADDVDDSNLSTIKLILDKDLAKYSTGAVSKLIPTKQCFLKWILEKRKSKKFRDKEKHRRENKEFGSRTSKYLGRAGKTLGYAWNEIKHGNILNGLWAGVKGIVQAAAGAGSFVMNVVGDMFNTNESSYDQAWREAKLVAYNFKKKENAIKQKDADIVGLEGIAATTAATVAVKAGVAVPHVALAAAGTAAAAHIGRGIFGSEDDLDHIVALEDKAMPIVDKERPDLDRDELKELAEELIPDEDIRKYGKFFGGTISEALSAKVDYIATWWSRIFLKIFATYLNALRGITRTAFGDKPHLNDVPQEVRSQVLDAFKKGAANYKKKYKLFDLIPTVKGYADWYMAIEKTAIDSATTSKRTKSLGEKVSESFNGVGHQFGEAWSKLKDGDIKGALFASGRGIRKLAKGTGKALSAFFDSAGKFFEGWLNDSTTVKLNWKEVRYRLYHYPDAIGLNEAQRARAKAINDLEKAALKSLENGEKIDEAALQQFGETAGILYPTGLAQTGVSRYNGGTGTLIGYQFSEMRNQENLRKRLVQGMESLGGGKIDVVKHNQYGKKYINFWIRKVFQPIFAHYITVINIYTGRSPEDGLLSWIGLNDPNPDDIKEEDQEEALAKFRNLATKTSNQYKDYPMTLAGLNKFIKESQEYEKKIASGNINPVLPKNSAAKIALETESNATKETVSTKITSVMGVAGDNADKGTANAVDKALSTLEQDVTTVVNTTGGADPDSLAAYLGVQNSKDLKYPKRWKYILGSSLSVKNQFILARLRAYSHILGDIPSLYFREQDANLPTNKWLKSFCDMLSEEKSMWRVGKNLEESLLEYQNEGDSRTLLDSISKIAAKLFIVPSNPYAVDLDKLVNDYNESWLSPYDCRNDPDDTVDIDKIDRAIDEKLKRNTDPKLEGQLKILKDKVDTWFEIIKEWVCWIVNPIFAYYTAYINKILNKPLSKMPDPTAMPSHQRKTALMVFLGRAEKLGRQASRQYLRDLNLDAGPLAVPVDKILENYEKYNKTKDTENNRAAKGSIARSGKLTGYLSPKEKDKLKKTSKARNGTDSAGTNDNESKYEHDPKDITKSADALKYFTRLEGSGIELTPEILDALKKERANIAAYAKKHDIPNGEMLKAIDAYFAEKSEKEQKKQNSDHKKMANGGIFSWREDGGVVDSETNLDNITIGEAGTETVLPHKAGGRFDTLLTNAVQSTYGPKTASAIADILNGNKLTKALIKAGLDNRELGDTNISPTDLILFNLYRGLFPKKTKSWNKPEEDELTDEFTDDNILDDITTGSAAGYIRHPFSRVRSAYRRSVNRTTRLMESATGSGPQAVTARENKARETMKAALSSEDTVKLAARIWKYFTSHGWTESAVAGVLGNLQKESGVECVRVQGDVEARDRTKSIKYTNTVGQSRDAFSNDSKGYGLAQWTYHTRKRALWDFAYSRHKSVGNQDIQIEFLFNEFEKGTPGKNGKLVKLLGCPLNQLKNCQDVRTATQIILLEFERPAAIKKESTRNAELNERAGYATEWYKRLAKGKVEKIETNPVAETSDTDGSAVSGPYQDQSGSANTSQQGYPVNSGGVTGAVRSLTGSQSKTNYTGPINGHGLGIMTPDKLNLSSDEIPTDKMDAVNKLKGLRTMNGANTSYGGGNWTSVAHLDGELIKRLYLAGKLYEQAKGDSAKKWTITSAFRSYADQAAIKKRYPRDAASPGHSRHETGIAVDLGDANFGGIKNKPYDRGTVVDELEPYLKAVGIDRVYRPGKLNEAQHFELRRGGRLPDISKLLSEDGAKQAVAEGKKEVSELPKTDPAAIKEVNEANKDNANNRADSSIDETVQAKQTGTANTIRSAAGVTYPDTYQAETKQLTENRAAYNKSFEITTDEEAASQQIQSSTETSNAPKITTDSVASGVTEVNNGSAGTLAALNYQSTILEAIKQSVGDICKSVKPVETKSTKTSEPANKPATTSAQPDNLAEVITNAMKEGFAAISSQLVQILQASNANVPAKHETVSSTTRRVAMGEFPVTTAKVYN